MNQAAAAKHLAIHPPLLAESDMAGRSAQKHANQNMQFHSSLCGAAPKHGVINDHGRCQLGIGRSLGRVGGLFGRGTCHRRGQASLDQVWCIARESCSAELC